ncbi:hypothetical protein BCR34DRAFT_599411 [Clohesyomyces aquaticus]|uniref:Uncharacterized protein n=1 Tax=Clohesyomyces aquaticus TaxID=1231657 RepID=A0A1Y1ZVG8_9PLEO|nr:hypothetical protein BCR34DRAFT_599411 [Clohesyomyces aquaticus]
MAKMAKMANQKLKWTYKGRPHHCGECGKALKQSCISKGHVAFCEAILPTGSPCAERYNVLSPQGCISHPYREGYNLELYHSRKSYQVPDTPKDPEETTTTTPKEDAYTKGEETDAGGLGVERGGGGEERQVSGELASNTMDGFCGEAKEEDEHREYAVEAARRDLRTPTYRAKPAPKQKTCKRQGVKPQAKNKKKTILTEYMRKRKGSSGSDDP